MTRPGRHARHAPDWDQVRPLGRGDAASPDLLSAPCSCGSPHHAWTIMATPGRHPNAPATAGVIAARREVEHDPGHRTCAWCGTTAPTGTMEPINAGPSVACKDVKACQGRIVDRAIAGADAIGGPIGG